MVQSLPGRFEPLRFWEAVWLISDGLGLAGRAEIKISDVVFAAVAVEIAEDAQGRFFVHKEKSAKIGVQLPDAGAHGGEFSRRRSFGATRGIGRGCCVYIQKPGVSGVAGRVAVPTAMVGRAAVRGEFSAAGRLSELPNHSIGNSAGRRSGRILRERAAG
jgi:hypothetical protein